MKRRRSINKYAAGVNTADTHIKTDSKSKKAIYGLLSAAMAMPFAAGNSYDTFSKPIPKEEDHESE